MIPKALHNWVSKPIDSLLEFARNNEARTATSVKVFCEPTPTNFELTEPIYNLEKLDIAYNASVKESTYLQ